MVDLKLADVELNEIYCVTVCFFLELSFVFLPKIEQIYYTDLK